MDELSKVIRKLEQEGFSAPVQMDEEGYLDKQCPVDGCRFSFKINGADWSELDADAQLHCPRCCHQAPLDQWVSEHHVDQLRAQAGEYVSSQIGKALEDLAKSFNRRHSKRGPVSISMNVTGGPRRRFESRPLTPAAEMSLKIRCEKCATGFAVIGAAYFCPCCGHNSVLRTFDDSIGTVETMLSELPGLRIFLRKANGVDEAERFCRAMVESGLGECVAAFQHFADRLYESTTGRKARRNAFQRIDEGSALWEEASGGRGYGEWLSDRESHNLARLFQQRHLLQHTGGIVDADYVERSGDQSYEIGQRIVVNPDDLHMLVAILHKLADGLRCAGSAEVLEPASNEPRKEETEAKAKERESGAPWSDEEIRFMAYAVYKGRRPRCPECQAPVNGRLSGGAGRSTSPVRLRCERCGRHGEFDPSDGSEAPVPFDLVETKRIVEDYWAQRTPTCPRDESILEVIVSGVIGVPTRFTGFCPRCGGLFSSRDVEAGAP